MSVPSSIANIKSFHCKDPAG